MLTFNKTKFLKCAARDSLTVFADLKRRKIESAIERAHLKTCSVKYKPYLILLPATKRENLNALGKGSKKNVPFSSLLLLRGPATPPPLVVPWAIKILGPYFFVK